MTRSLPLVETDKQCFHSHYPLVHAREAQTIVRKVFLRMIHRHGPLHTESHNSLDCSNHFGRLVNKRHGRRIESLHKFHGGGFAVAGVPAAVAAEQLCLSNSNIRT